MKKGCACITLNQHWMKNNNFHEHVNLIVFIMIGGFVLCDLCL
jgi:hypothetical protein